MKLGPVNKLDKRYKTTSKSFDGEVMSENCDVIAIFSIYDQFGAIWKPDSGHKVCKTYIFVNSKLLSYKDWKNRFFLAKKQIFCKKMLTSSKLGGSWY